MKKILAAFLLLIPTALLMPAAMAAQPLWSVERDDLSVDQDLLDDVFTGRSREFDVAVEGRDYRVNVSAVSGPNLGVFSLRGRFESQPESFFLLCRGNNGATVAYFQPGDGTAYRLDRTVGHDAVRPVEFERLGSCGGGLDPSVLSAPSRDPHPPARAAPDGDRSRAVADDGSRHDVLIGYTPLAEVVVGGNDYIHAEIQLAVDATNFTYDSSEINSQLRLVHVMPTDYNEGTAWEYEDHVEYLYYPNDNYMDDMLVMRDRVGADFVSVMIDGRDWAGDVPTCGVAPIMQAHMVNDGFEIYALSVVSVQCATSAWTLSHEIGHNRGCAHNREDAEIDGAFPYSYGLWFYYDFDTDSGFRTVMSYDHVDGGFTRVPYFSNPDVSFAGVPTGIAPGLPGEAHNALTQNNTSALCAGFRSERTFVEFRDTDYSDGSVLFPHPSIAQAIIDSRDGGHIVLNNGDPSFAGVMMEPRAYVHDSPGSAVLGGD